MTGIVTALTRYPIKGLSPETLHSIKLQQGQGFSGDRSFALALPNTPFDSANPKCLPKTLFLMLARQEALARLHTRHDANSGMLHVRDGSITLSASTQTSEGIAEIEAFFAQFLPVGQTDSRPRFVTAEDHSFTDVGVHSPELMRAVSVINLASVREFEARVGRPIDPRRFRANILVDGLEPWEEMSWLERELTIGSMRFRGARLTRRCPATEVNPDTAVRDINVPKELIQHYDHVFLGIYLFVLSDGELAVGDQLAPPMRGAGAI